MLARHKEYPCGVKVYRDMRRADSSPDSSRGAPRPTILNSKTGQEYIAFLVEKEYLAGVTEGDKTRYVSTEKAGEYIELFNSLYRKLFDTAPRFKL